MNIQFEFISGVELGLEILPSMGEEDVEYYFLLNLVIIRLIFIKLKPN